VRDEESNESGRAADSCFEMYFIRPKKIESARGENEGHCTWEREAAPARPE